MIPCCRSTNVMTDTEQSKLVVDMVKERNVLRSELVLLSEQIHKTQQGMREATEAANLASQGDWQAVERGFDYQDAPSFAQSIIRLRDVKARIDELEKRLDGC